MVRSADGSDFIFVKDPIKDKLRHQEEITSYADVFFVLYRLLHVLLVGGVNYQVVWMNSKQEQHKDKDPRSASQGLSRPNLASI